jgi:hypothetical protein
MMPEAIAIVCAPSFNAVGYFSITPALGMRVLRECQLRGFHVHDQRGLYESARHAYIDANAVCAFVDLR